MVSCTLRDVVYLPVLRGTWVTAPSPLGSTAAKQATARHGKGQQGQQGQGQQKQQGHLQGQQQQVDVAADAREKKGGSSKGDAGGRRSVLRAVRGRHLLALYAAFMVSGCMHELMN